MEGLTEIAKEMKNDDDEKKTSHVRTPLFKSWNFKGNQFLC